MAQKDVGNKIPIYKLKKTDEVMKYYDDWGQENKYDFPPPVGINTIIFSSFNECSIISFCLPLKDSYPKSFFNSFSIYIN